MLIRNRSTRTTIAQHYFYNIGDPGTEAEGWSAFLEERILPARQRQRLEMLHRKEHATIPAAKSSAISLGQLLVRAEDEGTKGIDVCRSSLDCDHMKNVTTGTNAFCDVLLEDAEYGQCQHCPDMLDYLGHNSRVPYSLCDVGVGARNSTRASKQCYLVCKPSEAENDKFTDCGSLDLRAGDCSRGAGRD